MADPDPLTDRAGNVDDVDEDMSTAQGARTAGETLTITASAPGWHFRQELGTWRWSEAGRELSAEISGDARHDKASAEPVDPSLPVTGRVILRLGSASAPQRDLSTGFPSFTPTVDGFFQFLSSSVKIVVGLARTVTVELNKMLGNPSEPPTRPISEVEIQLTFGADAIELRGSDVSRAASELQARDRREAGAVSHVTLQLTPGKQLVWRDN